MLLEEVRSWWEAFSDALPETNISISPEEGGFPSSVHLLASKGSRPHFQGFRESFIETSPALPKCQAARRIKSGSVLSLDPITPTDQKSFDEYIKYFKTKCLGHEGVPKIVFFGKDFFSVPFVTLSRGL